MGSCELKACSVSYRGGRGKGGSRVDEEGGPVLLEVEVPCESQSPHSEVRRVTSALTHDESKVAVVGEEALCI